MTATDASALEREVVELHGVIEGWFAGTRPRTAESYAGFAGLLTLDFTSVSPNGSSSSRDVVVSGLEAAHGAYPGITVKIRRSSSSPPQPSWESLATRSGSSTRLERARA
jgi:hypothetical protein